MVSYVKFVRCTQKFYKELTKKDQDTLYFVYEPNTADNGFLYLGNRLISGVDEHDGYISIFDVKDIILKQDLSDGDILLYNEGTKKWENHALQDLLTYSSMVGATEESDGAAGLVPVPTASDRFKFLMGDGTWQEVDVVDEELHAVTATLVGEDEGLSVRDIAENVVFDLKQTVSDLQELLNGAGTEAGLKARVKSLEDSIGEFTPVEGKYLNIGEAINYFDTSITSINDRLRWHKF